MGENSLISCVAIFTVFGPVSKLITEILVPGSINKDMNL